MQLINAPGKLVLPFANSGAKNSIPVASQIGITAGAASLTDGFPPLTRTPLAAGGVPPSGLDMNGILYELSAILRWANAGGGYVFDATFATDPDVAGYPKGARVLRSDGLGYWFNTVDGNEMDPEANAVAAIAAGWVPDFTNGVAAVTMTNANVTLTPLQYGKPIVIISGLLTANLNLIFPTGMVGEWTVINNTTGAYSVTCKTAAGTGVIVAGAIRLVGDGANIYATNTLAQTAPQFDSTTKSATTAFVQRALGNTNGAWNYAANATISTGAIGGVHLPTVSGVTLTLPDGNSCAVGSVITIHGNSWGCTVQCQGTNTIALGSGGAVTSVSVGAFDRLVLVNVGPNWYAIGGEAALGQSTAFASSKTASGYQKLPSGLIVQWGSGVYTATLGVGNYSRAISFPIAFPTACVSISQTLLTGDAAGLGYWATSGVHSLTAGGFTSVIYKGTSYGTWASAYISIGY